MFVRPRPKYADGGARAWYLPSLVGDTVLRTYSDYIAVTQSLFLSTSLSRYSVPRDEGPRAIFCKLQPLARGSALEKILGV